MRRFSACVVLCLVFLAGCDEPSRASNVPVQIVDALGANAALGCGPGTLDLIVSQGEAGTFVFQDAEVDASGGFDVPLAIGSYTAVTRIQSAFQLESCELLGAVPSFWLATAGVVRVVNGPPLTCADLDQPRLETGRTSPALVSLDANLLVVGGTTRGVSTDLAVPVSAIHLTIEEAIPATSDIPFARFSAPLRETRAISLGLTLLLVVSQDRAFTWDADVSLGNPEEALPQAHAGIGSASALVDLGSQGAAIVGGATGTGEDAVGVASITWVDAVGNSVVTPLVTPRRNPAAVFVGNGVLIAGGQAEGEPLLELARIRGASTAVAGSPTDARTDVILVAPAHRNALMLGGVGADGVVRAEATVISGCPECAIGATTAWAAPRVQPAIAETETATWLVGGQSVSGVASREVERIEEPAAGTFVVQELVEGLPTARARAGAAPLADGIVAVIGGLDETGEEQRSIALCWPRALDRLD